MELGKKIAALRKTKNLTQREFAKLMGISSSTIAMYETNKNEPDLGTIKKFANFFEVSIDYLLDHEFNNKKNDKLSSEELDVYKNMFLNRAIEKGVLSNDAKTRKPTNEELIQLLDYISQKLKDNLE